MTRALTEMVDVYPTLAALAGLPDPYAEGEHLNGTSMLPLFEDPDASTKTAAFSQFAKCGESCPSRAGAFNNGSAPVDPPPVDPESYKGPHNWFDIGPHYSRRQTTVMGYTIRVDGWRYTEWWPFVSTEQVGPRSDLPQPTAAPSLKNRRLMIVPCRRRTRSW